MAGTKTPTRRNGAAGGADNVWTDEERAAMQDSARERKAASRRSPVDERAQGEADIQAKIAALPEPERAMARRIHEIVLATAPELMPRTYYGMPAYARDGKTVCFFKPASKFKERYATFGFEQHARLDDGAMWPTSYAILELKPADEARIAALVKKAVG
jgi:uncharacterized protein YdhG (YjbR/CyaY superfamily)